MRKWGVVIDFILIGVFLWIACTSMIYRFENPTKSETEVFLHIPKSFILDFRAASNDKFEPTRE